MSARRVPVWPVWVLAAPAAVSIWAGWVGLGQLTGFGVVQLLPGIWDELRLNTSITLPVGMEAYAAYALYVWLGSQAPRRAREFARTSAIAALVLGSLGQVASHLMAAAGIQAAPWPITAAVSCLPVGVLGLAAALAHLVRTEPDDEPTWQRSPDATVPQPAPGLPPLRPALHVPPVNAATTPLSRVGGPPPTPGRPDPAPADQSAPVAAVRSADRAEPARADRSESSGPDRSAGRAGGSARTGLRAGRAGRPGPIGRPGCRVGPVRSGQKPHRPAEPVRCAVGHGGAGAGRGQRRPTVAVPGQTSTRGGQ